MEAQAGAGRASSPEGALPLQVGPIPLLDLGVDCKMFSDEGLPRLPRWMSKCNFMPPDLRRTRLPASAPSRFPAKSQFTPGETLGHQESIK